LISYQRKQKNGSLTTVLTHSPTHSLTYSLTYSLTGTSLVKLCQHALNYHIIKAAKSLHSDPLFSFSEHDPCIYAPSVHPTTWATNFIDNITGICSIKSNDDGVQMLYLLLKLLYKGFSMGILTAHRSALLSITSSVIESSDSPLLLSLTMEYSEQWIHTQYTSVLSYTEQWMLYSVICKNIGRFPDHPGYPHIVRANYLGTHSLTHRTNHSLTHLTN
jgi:hypothetical protein